METSNDNHGVKTETGGCHCGAIRFEVTADRAGTGVWSPARRWSFSGGIRWRQ